MIRKYSSQFAYLMLVVITMVFLALHSPNTDYDTPSYIHFDYTRPLLYPMFIWLFQWAHAVQYTLVMWAQGVLLFSALWYARRWMKKWLHVSDVCVFMICAFVLATISFHYQLWYIESEGIAFPLFIFAFLTAIDCFYQFELKKITLLSILVSLLVLTRLQFYYFYIVYLLLCVWYMWQKESFKRIAAAMLIFSSSMAATTGIDHGYHYIKHGYFNGGSYAGLMLLSQTLFLADDAAVNYFDDPSDKKAMQSLIDQRNKKHLGRDAGMANSFQPYALNLAYQAYARNYTDFQFLIDKELKNREGSATPQKIYHANEQAMHLNKILLTHEWRENSVFLLWKFVQCMGGVSIFLFYLILLIGALIGVIKYKIRKPSAGFIFVGLMAIVTFFNAGIIALCNPDLPIYFCYSQFMFYCLAAYVVSTLTASG